MPEKKKKEGGFHSVLVVRYRLRAHGSRPAHFFGRQRVKGVLQGLVDRFFIIHIPVTVDLEMKGKPSWSIGQPSGSDLNDLT